MMRLDTLICWRFDPFASLHRALEAREQRVAPRSHHPLWERVAALSDEKILACRQLCEDSGRLEWSCEEAASRWDDKVSCGSTLVYDELAREIELRSRPLRERWLGFAPGACRWLERALGEPILGAGEDSVLHLGALSASEGVIRVELTPILPHQGGGGGPRFLRRASLEYEAMLYDIDSRCPEWLRWLRGALAFQLVGRWEQLHRKIVGQGSPISWGAAWETVSPLADLLTVGAAAWVEVLGFDESTVLGLSAVTRHSDFASQVVVHEEQVEGELRRLLSEVDESALQHPESLAGWIDRQLRQLMPRAGLGDA